MPPLENQAKTKEALDYILLFVQTQEEFIDPFPHLKKLSKPQGMLSVSWPQGGKQGTDLYSYSLGLCFWPRINAIASESKFTHPKR